MFPVHNYKDYEYWDHTSLETVKKDITRIFTVPNIICGANIDDENKIYTLDSPLRFSTDLKYFYSSSAKFLYDIYLELKRLIPSGIPFIVEWFYEEEDIDLKEAGSDIALLAGMEFSYISKKSKAG